MNVQKVLSIISKSSFLLFMFLVALGLFDVFNIIDFSKAMGDISELMIISGAAFFFFIGVISSTILLTKHEELNLKFAKKTLNSFYIPIFLISILILIWPLIDNRFDVRELVIVAIFAISTGILFFVNINYNVEWKAGKIFMVIYNMIMGIVSSIFTFLVLGLSMHDGSIS